MRAQTEQKWLPSPVRLTLKDAGRAQTDSCLLCHATARLIWQIDRPEQQWVTSACEQPGLTTWSHWNRVSLQAPCDHSCKIHLSILTSATPSTLGSLLQKVFWSPRVKRRLCDFAAPISHCTAKCRTPREKKENTHGWPSKQHSMCIF